MDESVWSDDMMRCVKVLLLLCKKPIQTSSFKLLSAGQMLILSNPRALIMSLYSMTASAAPSTAR